MNCIEKRHIYLTACRSDRTHCIGIIDVPLAAQNEFAIQNQPDIGVLQRNQNNVTETGTKKKPPFRLHNKQTLNVE